MLSWPIQNTSQMEEGSIVPPITPMLHHKRHHGTELQPKGQVRIIRTVMQMGGQSHLYSSYQTSLVSLLIVVWLSVAVGKMRTCSLYLCFSKQGCFMKTMSELFYATDPNHVQEVFIFFGNQMHMRFNEQTMYGNVF